MSREGQHDPAFESLLTYIKRNRGFDFTEYKRASLMRRVEKRLNQLEIQGYEDYQDYLEVHPKEFAELFNTILINVTSFFRDPVAWDYLSEQVVPGILMSKTPNSTFRAWSAGCSSGEEAYSLAIILAEHLGLDSFRRQVKIYATDVDEQDLELARKANYSAEALEGVPEDLREKYFATSDQEGRFTFRQELRRSLIFGRHDLMHDAPISRLDLLLCRNTLIYFNREAQERIVARFHFALKENGCLFLGRAETMLLHHDLFEPSNLEHRIFRKIATGMRPRRVKNLFQADADLWKDESRSHRQLEQAVFENEPIAHFMVDQRGDLALINQQALQRLGLDLGDRGRPFRDLEISYRPLELRSLVEQSREQRQAVVVRDVEYSKPGGDERAYLDVVVTPLWGSEEHWLGASIVFQDVSERLELKAELEGVRHELETTHEALQSTNEELETSNEELQSTVEELQTTNEELQSSNEELETMNEELQSANAELQTLNDQLHKHTRDLNRAKAFLESILSSVEVGVW